MVKRSSKQMKELVIKTLKQHPQGLTVAELSELLNVHRQTATKYLFELIGAKIIRRRWIGAASLHYLKKDFEKIGKGTL